MVEMRVDEQDVWAVWLLLVFEPDPSRHPWERRVPAFAAGSIGHFAQPEVTFGKLHEAGRFVVQGHHLALFLAVVAADTEHAVSSELLCQIVALKAQRLLRTEQVRIELLDCFDQKLLALVPVIFSVAGRAIADVERHYAERIGGEGARE